jgi:hypothetical protein
MHVGVEINHRNPVLEKREDLNIPVFPAVIVILFERFYLTPFDGGYRRITDSPEGGAIRTVHFPDSGTTVQEAILIGSGSEHANHHLGNIAVPGGITGVHKV